MNKFLKPARYLLISLAVLIIVVSLTGERIGYYVLRNYLSQFADRTAMVLEMGAMGGSLFSRTSIKAISLHPASSRPQTFVLRADSLTCTYDLWDLQKGIDSFLSGFGCVLDSPELTVNLGTGETAAGSANSIGSLPDGGFAPRVQISNGTFLLRHPEWNGVIKKITARLQPTAGSGLELELAAGDFRVYRDNTVLLRTDVDSRLRFEDARLSVESLVMGDGDISGSGTLDLSGFSRGIVDFASVVRFGENQLNVSGQLHDRLLTGHLRTGKFELGELRERIGGADWGVDGTLKGDAAFTYNQDAPAELQGTFAADLRDGRIRNLPVDSLYVSGSLEQQNIKLDIAQLKSRHNQASVMDLVIPLPETLNGGLAAAVRKARAEFNADLQDVEPILELIPGGKVLQETVRPRTARFEGRLADGTVSIDEALLESAENRLAIRQAAIVVPEEGWASGLAFIRAARAGFLAEIGDPAPVLQLMQAGDLLPEAVQPRLARFEGHLEKGMVSINGAVLEAEDARLTITRAAVAIPENSETFPGMPVTASARLEAVDINRYAGAFGDIPVQGGLVADLELTGSIGDPVVAVSLDARELAVGDKSLGILTAKGVISSSRTGKGKPAALTLKITDLVQRNSSGVLTLAAPAEATVSGNSIALRSELDFSPQGKLRLVMTRTPGNDLSAEITAENLDSEGWLGAYIDDRAFFHDADLTASLKGWPGNPVLEAAGKVGRAGETNVPFPFSGSFDFRYTQAGIAVREFTWSSLDRNRITLAGFLPYDPANQQPFLAGELSLKGRGDLPALEDIAFLLEPYGITRGSLNFEVNISGTWENPVGSLKLETRGLTPPESLEKYLGPEVDFSGVLVAEGDSFILNSALLESPYYSARGAGSWKHALPTGELLRLNQADLQGELTGEAAIKVKDLRVIADRLDWLRRLDGDLQGRVTFSGPLRKPELKGSFTLLKGEAVHTLNFPKISAINLDGTFDLDSVQVDELRAELGGSPINARGSVYRDNDTASVRMKIDGRNILLFRDNDISVRGDVRLEAAGPVDSMTISGETVITGGHYTKNIDLLGMIGSSKGPVKSGVSFLFSFPEPPFKDASFDIGITSSESFRIRNNLIRSSLRPDLTLKGTGELPFVVGTVYIDPSRILLPSGRLQVSSGLLRFLEKEPDRPQLDLLAHSKILDYDIKVITRGPLDDPVITLSSNPPLPNEDLLVLLLTGQLPRKESFVGAKSSGTRNVLVYISRDFLNRWLEEDIGSSDESILDRFELDYGRGITRSGEQTLETTFRLTDQSGGAGRVFYLSGEKDRYDAYNYGLKLVFSFD